MAGRWFACYRVSRSLNVNSLTQTTPHSLPCLLVNGQPLRVQCDFSTGDRSTQISRLSQALYAAFCMFSAATVSSQTAAGLLRRSSQLILSSPRLGLSPAIQWRQMFCAILLVSVLDTDTMQAKRELEWWNRSHIALDGEGPINQPVNHSRFLKSRKYPGNRLHLITHRTNGLTHYRAFGLTDERTIGLGLGVPYTSLVR